MSNYYSMRDAKVNIAHELMEKGWKVYGYSSDKSDSMTDYYCPAYWDGIATKNGYILVVDHRTAREEEIIKKYNYNKTSFTDREKIIKLEAMTIENGATIGEAENAKQLVETLKNKESENVPQYEIVGKIPAHMANPGKSKWHIEKDGKIYDKGTGLTKFHDLPKKHMFDYEKIQYKEGYTHWANYGNGTREEKEVSEDLKKLVNDFKNLISRIENVAAGITVTGDGTIETEKEGLEAEAKKGYELIIEKVKKKVLKMVEVERKYFQIGDYITLAHHGHYWKITSESMRKGTWKDGERTENTFTYEIVGSATRKYQQLKNPKRYYDYEFRMRKALEDGKIKIFELKEVEEIQEVEKWEKIDKSKKTYNTTSENKQEETKEQININSKCHTCECFKNNCNGMSELYTGCIYYKKKIKQSITEENSNIKSIINHQYIITADIDTRDNSPLWVVKITDKLTRDQYLEVATQFKKIKGYYSKFKSGFIFKYDPTSTLKGEGEENSPDSSYNKTQSTIDSIVDYSTNIIIELGLKPSEVETNNEYKNRLTEVLKSNNITITDNIIEHMEFDNLKNVLKAIKQDAELQQRQEKQQTERTNRRYEN